MTNQFDFMLQRAILENQRGESANAERILKDILKKDPRNYLALNVIGLIKITQKDYKTAVLFLKKAIKINEFDPQLNYNLANALNDCKAYQEAIFYHKKTINLIPGNTNAWINYGRCLHYLNQYQSALECFNKALEIDSKSFEALLNKAVALNKLNHYSESRKFLDKALNFNPYSIEGWMNKGLIDIQEKKYQDAVFCFDKVLNLEKENTDAILNKGIALRGLKKNEESLMCFDELLKITEENIEALCKRGELLIELNQYSDALNSFEKALRINPQLSNAHCNIGLIFYKLRNYGQAIASLNKAVSLDQNLSEAHANRGNVLRELKEFDSAIIAFERALQDKKLDWLLGDKIFTKMQCADWSNLSDEKTNLELQVEAEEKVLTPLSALCLFDKPFLHKTCAQIYGDAVHPADNSLGAIDKYPREEIIRVGYYSADFRTHPVSLLLAELFELHDRKKFEIIAISFGIDDQSSFRSRLVNCFDKFIDVQGLSDRQVAALSRELKINIAIDLGGFTADNRMGIFAYRAAPIQVSYLGYPGSLGREYYDYIIADKVIIPKEYRKFYLEKVAYLPHSFMTDDSHRLMAPKLFTREEFGLPSNAFIFCAFNNAFKINEEMVSCWSQILLSKKDGVLWLSENNLTFKENIKKEFKKYGIETNRIFFAGRLDSLDEHLARCALADIFLDTHPYNSHSTAIDFLKVGVPIVARPGESFASRVSASLLEAIGMPELIVNSKSEYIQMAIDLSTNNERLQNIKMKLKKNFSSEPLFNSLLFVKNIEKLFMQMYERYQLGMPIDFIELDT